MMRYSWPVEDRTITSPFGNRPHPIYSGEVRFHSGVDVRASQGTEVRAPADGKIVKAWVDETYGGGLSVRLDTGDVTFGFAHLSSALVRAGDEVKEGDIIALSGGTPKTPGCGRSTGPHLHMTARRKGFAFDPMELEWR